jgi:hypothetical protein
MREQTGKPHLLLQGITHELESLRPASQEMGHCWSFSFYERVLHPFLFALDWIEPSEFRFFSPLGLHFGELFLSWTALQADRDEKRIKKQIKSVY